MTVRWRLAVLAVQLVALGLGTYLVERSPFSGGTWFLAGLLAVAINPQLLEPYYSRPGDVLANSVLALGLYAGTTRSVLPGVWDAFAVALIFFGFLSLAALGLGAGRTEGRLAGLGKTATIISRVATSRIIYSIIFFLALVEDFPLGSNEFRNLAITWALIVVLGRVNWQAAWSSAAGGPAYVTVEGLAGPSTLFVVGADIPEPGSGVTLRGSKVVTEATVVTRIRRARDEWGQLFVADRSAGETLLTGSTLSISKLETPSDLIGSVAKGSSDRQLRFVAIRPLEVAQVVAVQSHSEAQSILYQVSSATIDEKSIKGGSHLVTSVTAEQIGTFDRETLRLLRHRWVPPPGAAVRSAPGITEIQAGSPPDHWLEVGKVIGTQLPVFLDLHEACTGHLAILGMTKMGKTTLTLRLVHALANTRRTVILDQTGEYVGKHGLTPYDLADSWTEPGISVKETIAGEVGPDVARDFFDRVVEAATSEYVQGDSTPRTIVIEEAHQFVPEPSGLSFNTPGRDSSYALGVLVMQIRKYGLSMILISQRTAVVAKSALSQCENVIAFRSVDQTGLDYLEQIAGSEVRRLLPALRQGEALVFGPAFSNESPVALTVTR